MSLYDEMLDQIEDLFAGTQLWLHRLSSGRFGLPGTPRQCAENTSKAVVDELTKSGPVILLPDEDGEGVKVAKLDDIERLREHTTFAEDGEVFIRRYRPDEWRYALIDAVRMVAE